MAHLLAAKSLNDIVDEDEWNELIGIPSSTQTITAAADTILADARVIVLNPDADYTMTSTPTIADGTTTGQLLRIICGNAEANTITLQDQDTLANSNLQLTTALRTITGKQIITLMFDGTDWVEEGTAAFTALTIGDGTNQAVFDTDGDLSISNASPEILLQNLTEEDGDNGRESGIRFKGEQSGAEVTTLARILASHDGAADDEKGQLEFYTNDTNDGDTPTLRVTIDAAGNTKLGDGGTTNYLNVDVAGAPSIINTSPELLLRNNTSEDTDGGRESGIRFKGYQSGAELTTLARILASHNGAADDEKGQLEFYTNDTNDGDTPTLRMVIDSDGNITMGDGGTTNYLNVDVAGALSIINTSPEILLRNNTAEDASGGRESGFRFKGEQSGNEVTTLGKLVGSHDGAVDDEKGRLDFFVNDGSDGDVPTLRMTIFSNGNVLMGDEGADTYAYVAPTGGFVMYNISPEILLWNKTAEDISGGRESEIVFRGRQSGTETSKLVRIMASHDGAADDEKGKLEFYVNDGNDGNSPTLRATIDSDGTLTLTSGVLALAETTTPTPVNTQGKLYTKNDNNLYFQSGDNVEHTVLMGATGIEHTYVAPLEDPTGTVGNWDVVSIGTAQSVHFALQVPEDFEILDNAKIIIIPDANETIQWDVLVSVAAAGEAYDNDDRSSLNDTLAVTINLITEVDISGVLTGLAAGDYIAIDFQSDTASIRVVGFEFDYN